MYEHFFFGVAFEVGFCFGVFGGFYGVCEDHEVLPNSIDEVLG